MAGEVSRLGTFWIGQYDIAEVPLVSEMAVSDCYADREDVSHRLRVYHEVVRVRVRRRVRRPRQSKQVGVVFLLLQPPV